MYISHNCDHIDSRGLERVRVSDGARQPLVTGDPYTVAGMSQATEGPSGGIALSPNYAAWLQSGWHAPAAVRILHMAAASPPNASSFSSGGARPVKPRRAASVAQPTAGAITITDDKVRLGAP